MVGFNAASLFADETQNSWH